MVRRLHYKRKFQNKKGLSAIVITVILIALSMAAIVLVWVFINKVIKEEIKSSESCFGNFDKIKINRQYTCYEQDGLDYNLRFSLIIEDVQVDKVIVSVSSESAVKSYGITNTPQSIAGLTMYPSGITNVNLSGPNGGLTYKATGFGSKIDLIKIAPVIGGSLCEVSDSLSEIEDCILIS